MNLFEIEGVDKQRKVQCAKCPDGAAKLDDTARDVISRSNIQAHRCHETPIALCAGPHRPRILSTPGGGA